MDELLRTLDDYAKIVNRMHKYGYIGNIGEEMRGSTRHFCSDHLIALVKTGVVEPTIIKRGCGEFPYRMEVRVGTHILYCLLRQGEYEELLREAVR